MSFLPRMKAGPRQPPAVFTNTAVLMDASLLGRSKKVTEGFLIPLFVWGVSVKLSSAGVGVAEVDRIRQRL